MKKNFLDLYKLFEAVEISDLDSEFLKKAMRLTNFNLSTRDFESLEYKKEIQFLFRTHFFPGFDLDDCLDEVNAEKINSVIAKLKALDSKMFTKMHKYNLKGVGPGEATLYFILNKGHLGGGASAGVDLVHGSSKYEVKAVTLSSTGHVKDFKIGGTENLSGIISDAVKLKKKAIKRYTNRDTEINKSQIGEIKRKFPTEWSKIENEYKNQAYNYFKEHDVIFMNNKTKKIGEIIAIKKVKKSDIELENITSGTIKPAIKVK